MADIINFHVKDFFTVIHLAVLTPIITKEDSLDFTVTLQNTSDSPQKAEINYSFTFNTPDGLIYSKIYKLSNRICPKGFIQFSRKHPLHSDQLPPVVSGTQQLSVIVNGRCLKTTSFQII